MTRALLALAVLAAIPIASNLARAQDDARLRGVVHQQLVGLLNPMGAEHLVAAGVRARLGDPEEPIFTDAHAEAGVIEYTSPIYSITGGYLQVSPIALLILRAELAGHAMWALPGVEGAGYVASSDGAFPDANAETGEATGWSLVLSAVVQGAVPIGPTRLLMWNQTGFEHLRLGSAPRYFYPRYDMVLDQSAWTIANAAMLLLEIDLGDAGRLRLGLYDDLRFAPSNDYLNHQAGVIAALAIPVGDSEVMPLVRAGLYSDGRRAGDPTLVVGVRARWDLGALR